MSDQFDPMAALYGALADAQGAFPKIPKSKSVDIGKYKYRYAPLESILDAVRPVLVANGLSLFQTMRRDGDRTILVTIIAHRGGGRIESEVELPITPETDTKTAGGTVTYWRRYAASALLGVAADDDADENGVGIEEEAELRLKVNELVEKAFACATDAEALALWKANQKALAEHPASYQRLRKAIEQRRRDIRGA